MLIFQVVRTKRSGECNANIIPPINDKQFRHQRGQSSGEMDILAGGKALREENCLA